MSARSHSPSRHRGRRKKGRGDRFLDTASAQSGAGQGMPRYLARPAASAADVSSASESEARSAETSDVQEAPVATPMGTAAAEAMEGSASSGRRLDEGERAETEERLGMDFSDVRVTENSALASAFGANAMTYADAIHVAPGSGLTTDLLGHELTHVAQQRQFGASAAQFDISLNAANEDTGLGLLNMALRTAQLPIGGTPAFGMFADIDFDPHDSAPYSNRIGFLQTVDVEQITGAGSRDMVWGGDEANRENVKTPEGTFIDLVHGGLSDDRNTEPWYWQGFTGRDPNDPNSTQRFGWNRSANDQHSAHMTDFPRTTQNARFTFETIPFGRDNQVAYGAVNWGFETDGSTGTSNEWLTVSQINQSGTGEEYQSELFDRALDEFRDFYVHEPIILYFGYNESVPADSELDKMDHVSAYMTEHPEVQIRLTASADMQGGVGASNRQLALDRMNAVHNQLLLLGVAPDRVFADGASANASRAEGSQDPVLRNTEGSYQANRRVTLTFQRIESAAP